jgi:chromosome segregation ATPase
MNRVRSDRDIALDALERMRTELARVDALAQDRLYEIDRLEAERDRLRSQLAILQKAWIERGGEGIDRLWDQLQKAKAERDRLRKAIHQAIDELGIPDANYPQPVANAHDILCAVLDKEE